MSTYALPIRAWADPLRNFAIGASLASFFLVPTGTYPVLVIEQQMVKSETSLVIASTHRFTGSHYVLEAISSSLEAATSQRITRQTNDKIELDRIPYLLREMSGLPIETLASLAHVSRNAYYKWLDGKGVSDEHAKQLTELLSTFRTIHDLRGPALKEFLVTPGPTGKPVDLLEAGKHDVVIGLALRPLPTPTELDSVSKAARDISGLPGWTRPATRLNWDAPHLSDVDFDHALDRLNPRPPLIHSQPSSGAEEDDEAFVAWGFVWE